MTEEWLRGAIDAAAGAITENASLLDELDAATGDGDHGSNLSRGFRAVAGLADELAVLDLGKALHQAGMTLVTTVGGAAGPALRQSADGHGESRPTGPGCDTRRLRGDAAPGDRRGAASRQGRRRREDDAGRPSAGLRGARRRCGGRRGEAGACGQAGCGCRGGRRGHPLDASDEGPGGPVGRAAA